MAWASSTPKPGASSTSNWLWARIPSPVGEAVGIIEIRRDGPDIRIQAHGIISSWRILLRGVDAVQSVEGGTTQAYPLGTLIIPAEGATALSVGLRSD